MAERAPASPDTDQKPLPAPTASAETLPPAAPLEGASSPGEGDPPLVGFTDAPPATLAPGDPLPAGPDRATPSVPGYEIVKELGRGGMGVVYQARQLKLNRIVALKMILSGAHAGSADLVRFLTEAEAVAQLQHPNVVQLFESGQRDGLPFFTLEFMTGGSLADKLRGTPLEPREAARLVERIARGVQHAHERGLIHRDLKPHNVLLTEDGTPKVTDFGLVRRVESGSGMTATGAMLGTPSYMAPEQASGDGKRVGPAADVYGLGAILYECLTGRPPFQAPTPLDTVVQVVSEEPVPPTRLQPKVPRDLETICLKCLQKEPGKRYASAADLAEDLRRFQNGEPIVARPVGSVERAVKWVKRRPTVAALTATVVLVGLTGVAGISWKYLEAEENLAKAQQAEQAEREGAEAERRAKNEADEARKKALMLAEAERRAKNEAEAARKDALTQLNRAEGLVYSSTLARAQLEWEANNVAVARDLLESCRWELRGWEHNYLFTLYNHHGQRALRGHTDHVNSVAFSPDGKRLASGSMDWTVKVWDASTGQETHTLRGHTSFVTSVTFSPDGKRLASASGDQTVKVWDASTGQETHTLRGHTGAVYCVAFSPDGKRLASASWDSTVKVWDTVTGQETLTLRGHAREVGSVAFSPDGQRLASASWDSTVKLWDASTGQKTLTLRGHTRKVGSVAFSPDGQRLASASDDMTVKVWDAQTGQETLTLRGAVASVAFSPNGKRLASASWDQTVKVWDAVTGQEALTLHGHTGTVNSAAFSPDGKRLASASRDNTVKVWDALTGQELLTLPGHTDAVHSVAFSPDGGRLASASGDGTVKVWDAQTGQELLTLRGHTATVWSVSFSSDGKRLASSSSDKTVKIWNATTGLEALTLRGHTDVIYSVVFSPDGKRLASASEDKTVKVWDASMGK